MRKGWEIDDYVKYIKMQMGGSVVDLMVEDQLPFIIEKIALEELKNYMHTIYTMTCAYAPMIDLEGKDVENVKYILRNNHNAMTITGLDTNLAIYQQNGAYAINRWAKDQMVYNLQISQIRNTLSSDMDFNFDKVNEKLYIYAQYPIPQVITIGYTPLITNVNQIFNHYWISYLRRFALAFTKESEGRIRSKYTLNSANFSLDGQQLLSEAQSELAQIRDELSQNVNIMQTIS